MRVFIGLTEVAGYYKNLAKGLGELGVESRFVDLTGHAFQYSADADDAGALVRFYRSAAGRRAALPATRVLTRVWWAALQKACLLAMLGHAVLTCRVFVFSYGTTFFRYRELPLLKLLGKRILYVFHGTDHRPPYLSGVYLFALDDGTLAACCDLTKQIKRKLQTIERYADVIVGHHLSAHLHEKPFVPALVLGLPFSTTTGSATTAGMAVRNSARIVHAPSRPREKGSPRIRAAVESLQSKGFAIEFVELVNQPNRIVLEELSICDFVVDELYSDTRMAGLATEAAFFGKPAVVGGYARDEDLAITGVMAPGQFPPVHFCHPDDIESAIETLVANVPYRLELGQRAQAFVSDSWTPRQVAQRYLRLMQGEIPVSWLFDPKAIRYVHGAGMPESVARAGLRRIIERSGLPALSLADKPELERVLLAFAGDHAMTVELSRKEASGA